MLGNWHVRCGAGEKLEITSKVYLLLTKIEKNRLLFLSSLFLLVFNQLKGRIV
jgi:hypothetical protein